MSKRDKKSSRELGLEVASICGQYFFGLEHLHYGLWTDDLTLDLSHLGTAQDRYTEFLLGHVPKDVKTVLDVGCGTGKNARWLLDRGREVDCISPSHFLKEKAAKLLDGQSRIFECTYEQFETEHKYDCILFAESFQYIKLEAAIKKSVELLNDGGYILICDVFRRSEKDIGQVKGVGGGHKIDKFFKFIEATKLEKIADEDITEKTAPNIELLDEATRNVGGPIMESTLQFLHDRYPLMTKIVCRIYRNKLDKVRSKYMGDTRTSDNFRKYKTYRLLLFRKKG